MANAYVLRYEPGKAAVVRETMTSERWAQVRASSTALAIDDESGNIHDVSAWVSELNIVHNELDSEKSGRDKDKGTMKRKLIATKHTLNVKLSNHVPQAVAYYIFALVDSRKDKLSFWARYQFPCGNRLERQNFYCSSINFGAQRYDRHDNTIFYDGMSFNMIEM